MSINKIFSKDKSDKNEKEIYASSWNRSTAAAIDITITLFLRVFVAQAIGIIYINQALKNFLYDFTTHFGTDFVKDNPEHINFILHHPIFPLIIVFYALVIFVGAAYHAAFNSSAWEATIGKRIMKIAIVRPGGDYSFERITFMRALSHYFLSVLPFVFIIYILSYQLSRQLTFFQAITASELNLFLGILFIFWVQIHLFTKKKTTAYDLICETILINRKTAAKFPWGKNRPK